MAFYRLHHLQLSNARQWAPISAQLWLKNTPYNYYFVLYFLYKINWLSVRSKHNRHPRQWLFIWYDIPINNLKIRAILLAFINLFPSTCWLYPSHPIPSLLILMSSYSLYRQLSDIYCFALFTRHGGGKNGGKIKKIK